MGCLFSKIEPDDSQRSMNDEDIDWDVYCKLKPFSGKVVSNNLGNEDDEILYDTCENVLNK